MSNAMQIEQTNETLVHQQNEKNTQIGEKQDTKPPQQTSNDPNKNYTTKKRKKVKARSITAKLMVKEGEGEDQARGKRKRGEDETPLTEEQLFKYIQEKSTDINERQNVAKKIANFLDKEQNVYVINNLLSHLSSDQIIEMIKKTIEIQRNGGKMTKGPNPRKRTSGGIFLELCLQDVDPKKRIALCRAKYKKQKVATEDTLASKNSKLYSLTVESFCD
eukprot:TRINITY_DN11648_c0_g1_i1.p1 TRINITY_DN11648_c0_g1~~TRINITY_DN11648_c0_g1_i1.p1  ORF type:complete len:219 (+),score=41.73 TRINITY_DN11648_c0_g1_i1:98-754(+)